MSSDEDGVPLQTGSRGSSSGDRREGDWATVQACSGEGDLPAWSAARPSLIWLRVRPGVGPPSMIWPQCSSRLRDLCFQPLAMLSENSKRCVASNWGLLCHCLTRLSMAANSR